MIYCRARPGHQHTTFLMCSDSRIRTVLPCLSRHSCFLFFLERPGAGEEGAAVDHEHRPRGAHHGLRQVHPGRVHSVQSNDEHCVQLCGSGPD